MLEIQVKFVGLTCDWFGACSAPLGEQLAEAIGTIGFVLSGSEPLSRQGFLTMGTSETLSVPRVIPISYAPLGDDLGNRKRFHLDLQLPIMEFFINYLLAFRALGREFVLIAFCTVDVLLLWNKGFGSNGVIAHAAHEALLMPLPRLVFHFFHACRDKIYDNVLIHSRGPAGQSNSLKAVGSYLR